MAPADAATLVALPEPPTLPVPGKTLPAGGGDLPSGSSASEHSPDGARGREQARPRSTITPPDVRFSREPVQAIAQEVSIRPSFAGLEATDPVPAIASIAPQQIPQPAAIAETEVGQPIAPTATQPRKIDPALPVLTDFRGLPPAVPRATALSESRDLQQHDPEPEIVPLPLRAAPASEAGQDVSPLPLSRAPIPSHARNVSESRVIRPILAVDGEADTEPSLGSRMPRASSDPAQAPLPAPHSSGAAAALSEAVQPTSGSPSPTASALATQPTATPAPPAAETRIDQRIAPQIERAIEALTDIREVVRSVRPEVLMRHGEFGLVNMRLDTAAGDLRASLSSRDPGFVPAIQSALAERAMAASGDTAASHNQRGQEHGSTGQNTAAFSGSGANYGSSPGSSQGSPQPRLPQQGNAQHGTDQSGRSQADESRAASADGSGLFA
ncbi:hypothetical protein [Erythrobacter sp. JK5]|uniref:hypothetical protein n=1 Tax=Erythrobacter sp. JK5 TaxID=2829500 RepID=UPI001BA45120|nr:hypothetical protein [Erythrobacter sp. JK5]QUL36911.1 hypothetical protein KDC96_10895 [Erythrobacter sp. JK5]